MVPFDFHPRTRVVFGHGTIASLGTIGRDLGFRRTLLVADPGVVGAGHAARGADLLAREGIETTTYSAFGANPDSAMADAGARAAAPLAIDSIVGLGGGSSLDAAKAINFLLTNGGSMADYRGYGKARVALLPMIGVPTTAGTGSEAQSYAVISDAATHMKMACGDPSAAVRVAILDPDLTMTAPRSVTAMSGYDAIAHAVETVVTKRRTPISGMLSREAWRLLDGAFERVLLDPSDAGARAAMQVGSHLAGMAIEQSMLGAAHACANPLTARYDMAHGLALAAVLPHVVRWNAAAGAREYAALGFPPGEQAARTLADRLDALAAAGALPKTLSESGVTEDALPDLAALAAQQWTGTFNPRPFDAAGALEIYRAAL